MAVFCALGATVAVAETSTIYTTWPSGGVSSPAVYSWTDADGNPVEIKNNGTEYAVIRGMTWSQGFNSGCDWNLYGLCFDNADKSYADGSGILGLQRGGFKCTQACRFASAGNNGITFKLIAGPQTWEGPDTGDYASIGTGDDGHNAYDYYHKGKVAASSDVFDWTISKRLALWMFYENAISHVKVRLESPARIYLPTEWTQGGYTVVESPKLGATQLTLAGEDVMWFAGVKTTATLPMCGTAPTGVLNPAMDSATVAPKLILENGADVQVENATWDIPDLVVTGAGATSALIGDLTFLRASTAVELKDGAKLAFAAVNRERDVSAGVSVTGTGTVRIATADWGLTGTLSLGSVVDLELSGVNAFPGTIFGGKSLILDPGAGKVRALDAVAYASMSDKKITLKSGTLCLTSMSTLPETATIEIAADAAVVFASNAGYDANRITGDGAANVTFDSKLITDAVVTEPEIVVYTNEVLRVVGNGLTAATTVRLAGGTLRFDSTATVASPISVAVGSFVEAIDENIVGTISGAVTCVCGDGGRQTTIPVEWGSSETATVSVNGLWNLGPGSVTYAGGGSFSGTRDVFVVTRDARVCMTGGVYDFATGRGDTCASAMVRLIPLVNKNYGYGRHLRVQNGGSLIFKGHAALNECVYVAAPKNGSDYNLSPWISTFEVGTNGTVTIPSKGRIHLGSVDSLVQFKISGGRVNMASDTAQIFVGDGGATAGADILLQDGTLSLGSPILREKGGDATTGNRSSRGRLIWTGGTLKLNEHFNASVIFDLVQELKDNANWQVSGLLRQLVQINGTGCILDLSEMGCASVANVPAGLDQAEWYGTGTLTVTGGKELVMNAFPNAISFQTDGEGTKIAVPQGAYVYDNAECIKYLNTKTADNGVPYSVTNGALASASVTTFTSAGTNCTFAVTRTGLPLSVGKVSVIGDWNNVRSVSSVGGLTLGNLTFEEGSMLSVASKDGGTVCQQLTGMLTLPSSLYVRSVCDADISPTGAIALTAGQGVVGNPTWMGVGSFRAKNDNSTVMIYLPGFILYVR